MALLSVRYKEKKISSKMTFGLAKDENNDEKCDKEAVKVISTYLICVGHHCWFESENSYSLAKCYLRFMEMFQALAPKTFDYDE